MVSKASAITAKPSGARRRQGLCGKDKKKILGIYGTPSTGLRAAYSGEDFHHHKRGGNCLTK